MTVEYEQIRYEVDGPVLTITLNRPERLNAFTGKMAEELVHAYDQADADDAVRAIVVTGAGRGFCAGADLGAGAATFDHRESGEREDTGGIVSLRVFACLKPVIVAFNGPAVGVGVTMTLPADIRIASKTARFGFVFAKRGIVLEAASSWFLSRVVGISRALEWAATGRIFNADEALASGFVRSIHEPDELLPAAYALAHEIADGTAPVSVALNRQMLWRMLAEGDPYTAHELDSAVMKRRGASADSAEGVTAFVEKRPSAFPEKVSSDMPDVYPWWPDRPFTALQPRA